MGSEVATHRSTGITSEAKWETGRSWTVHRRHFTSRGRRTGTGMCLFAMKHCRQSRLPSSMEEGEDIGNVCELQVVVQHRGLDNLQEGSYGCPNFAVKPSSSETALLPNSTMWTVPISRNYICIIKRADYKPILVESLKERKVVLPYRVLPFVVGNKHSQVCAILWVVCTTSYYEENCGISSRFALGEGKMLTLWTKEDSRYYESWKSSFMNFF